MPEAGKKRPCYLWQIGCIQKSKATLPASRISILIGVAVHARWLAPSTGELYF